MYFNMFAAKITLGDPYNSMNIDGIVIDVSYPIPFYVKFVGIPFGPPTTRFQPSIACEFIYQSWSYHFRWLHMFYIRCR